MSDLFQTQNILNLVGGAIILFYLLWQVMEKAFGNIGWVKDRRKKREEEKKEVVAALVQETIIPPILEEIENINAQQNVKLDNLVKSTNDTMRVELTRIYFKYQPYKKIPQWAKESATHLYDDYVSQDGNTFVKGLWEQMNSWEVVPNETYIERKEEKI